MLAAYAARIDRTDPLAALEVGERPDPAVPDGWSRVHLRAAALNRHDLWSLQGVGLSDDKLPMILGCDGAGVTDDGRDVILHSVIPSPIWTGEETLDPRRTLLSEKHDGTFAEQVVVPTANLVTKPEAMPWSVAGCLSTAWLTAYRMLFSNAGVSPGDTVLVQGAGGGVSTALVQLGSAAGLRMWVTSRDEQRGARAVDLGAERAFGTGERLPERVNAVMESVGAATWSHSVNSLNPGGRIVICGATSGDAPQKAELTKIFFKQLQVIGSTMGSITELRRLVDFVAREGISPVIDQAVPLGQARDAFTRLAAGDSFGKIVLTMGD
ncbi:zinc-binding dehydrogenase [Flexivirga sp. B27]